MQLQSRFALANLLLRRQRWFVKHRMIASRPEAGKHCLHDGRIALCWAMDSQLRTRFKFVYASLTLGWPKALNLETFEL
jgi:hypothetical protein